MKQRFIAVLAGLLVIYDALSGYIGWNGWLFLSELTGWETSAGYASMIAVPDLGFWGPPVRIGSRSEVLRIDVEFEEAAPGAI